jgi:acetate kinase
MNVLLLNAGSSSLKATLMRLETGDVLARGAADWAGQVSHYEFAYGRRPVSRQSVDWRSYGRAVDRFVRDLTASGVVASLDQIQAAAHRIVHGGPFRTAVRMTPEIRRSVEDLIELAPLHNPPSLETLAAAERILPNIPHIAAFDTAFHATLPPEACTYAIPSKWTEEWGIRRFGFHGLSHSYCAGRAAELLGRSLAELKIVSCHLGHGCSLAAVDGGRCIDTTMGYTPLEGLMMGTRSGSIDPGALLHLQKAHGLTAPEMETALNKQSGLLGVSGVSADLREVLSGAASGHPGCGLALKIYVHRIRQAIGAMAASLGGIDGLAFTGGVGEHAVSIRQSVCESLSFLGVTLDPAANAIAHKDAVISSPSARVGTVVVTCREDLSMLSEVLQVLAQSARPLAETSPLTHQEL